MKRFAIWNELVLFLFLNGLSVASSTGNLAGEIRDPSGAAVTGAVVRVQRWDRDNLNHPVLQGERVTRTDSEGKYSIELDPGIYDVLITTPEFSPVARKVKIVSSKPTVFSPKLKFDPLVRWIE